MSRDAFDEKRYLQANQDVASAVRAGLFHSGFEHYEKHGRHEGRHGSPSPPLSRADKLLQNIDRAGRGLEIGPSHNPIASKKAGFDVDILDHLGAADLKAKYAGHGVNLENIEEVDFVWTGEALPDLMARTHYYDWIIASHVIEHTPDLISFLQQCETLLKPDGRLALIIPDKRYCFDHFQPISLTGSFLDAFQERRKRPSPGQVFDHMSNAVKRESELAWSAGTGGAFKLVHPLDHARDVWNKARSGAEYLDVHCWRFTPVSFRIVMSDLNALGLTCLSVYAEYDTEGCEFYSILTKGAGAARPALAGRLELLAQVQGA